MNQVTGFFKDRFDPMGTDHLRIPAVAPDGKHTVPLVTYNNGDRREVGEALVNVEAGIVASVTVTLTEEVAQNLGLYVALDSVSMPGGATGVQATIQNRMSLKREN